MSYICYVEKSFRGEALEIIETANRIIQSYQAQGYELTLRQLYYQFVARDLIPNTEKSYKRIGSIVSDARMAGLISWKAITDRTRNLQGNSHWSNPSDIIRASASSFKLDLWETQPYRVECWVEKDALIGVVGRICQQWDVPYFACRGYTSQSEMWAAGQRLKRYADKGQTPYILHLGDHDPSGIDMSRDVVDRLELFMGDDIDFQRLALNYAQIETYNPPPNPAKTTDSRAGSYISQFGNESWELDALEPSIISSLIETAVTAVVDNEKWEQRKQLQEDYRDLLKTTSNRWPQVQSYLQHEN